MNEQQTASSSLNIIYAGTPEFAACVLKTLLTSRHKIVAVYTQPDKPYGRGLKLASSAVKLLALEKQLPLFQPKSLKDSYEVETLKNFNADVMVVAAYGLLLPADVLRVPRLGCINIHPSLLPRWRGAAPIQRTIYEGDSISGVTIMQMDQGLDTGPILLKREYVLDPQETSVTLTHKLAELGGSTLIDALNLLAQNKLVPIPQNEKEASYAQKLSKEEALIDWRKSAIELEREIRAFNPWPIAYTTWQQHHLRIWSAKAIEDSHSMEPRTIVRATAEGIDIATGKGILRLLQLQLPGGKVITASDFYNARRDVLTVGKHFI